MTSSPARVGPDLGVTVAGIKMRNPVMIASGVFGYGREYADLIDLSTLGAIVVKGTSLDPREGNPPPRTVETAAGMLNSIGLQNPGVDYFLKVDLPWLRGFDVPVIVNVVGDTVEDYAKMADRLEGVPGVAALEANISCPNVDKGGLAFGADPVAAGSVVAAMRRATSLPLIVKLTPNVTDITAIAKEAVAAGADAISLINTLVGMAIDLETKQPVLARGIGGLSGPAIKPVALAAVYRVAAAVAVPIIGMGGLWTGRDAAEFLMAGASAVAVGTAIFADPSAPVRVAAELGEFMTERSFGRVADMVGLANKGFLGRYPPSAFAGGAFAGGASGGGGPGGSGSDARSGREET
jgi:dihydroorotate dehydrogenase (NAD+) catalytic subunit